MITIQETEDDWEQPPLQLDNFQICPNAEPFQAFYEHKIDPDTIEKVQPSSEEVQLTGIYKGEPQEEPEFEYQPFENKSICKPKQEELGESII